MIGPWERIEGSSHDDELDAGVEARVADPLWMLARQWQVGEFRGDDAGSPIAARVEWSARTLTSYRPGTNGPIVPMPTARPLERVVEAAPAPTGGAAGLHWSARLAAQVARRLMREHLEEAVVALRAGFALPSSPVVALPGAGTGAAALLRVRSFDGAALLAASEARTNAVLRHLADDPRAAATSIIRDWRAGNRSRFETPPVDTWDDERLEHRFSVTAGTGSSEVVLAATEYTGGHLDWFSFDVEPRSRPPADNEADARADRSSIAGRVTAIPTPIRYAGMPAPRWWAFEDGDVHLGDIAAAPGDLGRLLLADYATVYGDDWFSIPLRLPLGTVSRIDLVHVHDTMGGRLEVPAAALVDGRTATGRTFRLYELARDPSVADGLAPLLFLPPSLAGSELGPVLEQVEFVRDEAANLAWGIERLVEGPTGRAVDRLQHWRTATPGAVPSSDGAGEGAEVADRGRPNDGERSTDAPTRETWRYRLESTAPPFWIPFVPTPTGSGAQVRLRRARMQEWELLDRDVAGPKGELLQSDRSMVIEEEEVPRGGVSLDRRWQLARWTDGSVHVWLQRSKQLGHGERSSGVRWDILEDVEQRSNVSPS